MKMPDKNKDNDIIIPTYFMEMKVIKAMKDEGRMPSGENTRRQICEEMLYWFNWQYASAYMDSVEKLEEAAPEGLIYYWYMKKKWRIGGVARMIWNDEMQKNWDRIQLQAVNYCTRKSNKSLLSNVLENMMFFPALDVYSSQSLSNTSIGHEMQTFVKIGEICQRHGADGVFFMTILKQDSQLGAYYMRFVRRFYPGLDCLKKNPDFNLHGDDFDIIKYLLED
jgi:hypothetical protein